MFRISSLIDCFGCISFLWDQLLLVVYSAGVQNYYDVLNIDSDGDGADFFSDCDDSDANNTIGSSSDCPGLSCAAILDVHSSSVDGNYFIDPREEGGFEVECDMSNGGFTKCSIKIR